MVFVIVDGWPEGNEIEIDNDDGGYLLPNMVKSHGLCMLNGWHSNNKISLFLTYTSSSPFIFFSQPSCLLVFPFLLHSLLFVFFGTSHSFLDFQILDSDIPFALSTTYIS